MKNVLWEWPFPRQNLVTIFTMSFSFECRKSTFRSAFQLFVYEIADCVAKIVAYHKSSCFFHRVRADFDYGAIPTKNPHSCGHHLFRRLRIHLQ